MTLNDDEFRRVISRYRHEPAAALSFSPAVEKLLDEALVADIQRDFRENVFKWERRNATSSLASQLPRNRGIYMFVWTPGPIFEFDAGSSDHHAAWVLYIGKAGVEGGAADTFRDRYRQAYQRHVGGDPALLWREQAIGGERENRLKRFLSLRPLQYWYLAVQDVSYIPLLEKRLIEMFRPPLNKHHCALRARFGKPSPAW